MKKKLKASSLVEVLIAFSILGISLGIAALIINHSLFLTYNAQQKKQKALALANLALESKDVNKTKWTDGEMYCTKQIEKVSESGRIISVIVKCYHKEVLLIEKKAYQNKSF